MGLYYRLRRGREEEILLLKAQGLALDVVVCGVEHLGDDLAHRALLEAFYIFALGEQVHIQRARAPRVPQAQDVDRFSAVAGYEHVARNSGDGLIARVLGVISAEAVPSRGDRSSEADLDGLVVARYQPAFGRRAPVVCHLGLPAVDDLLAEDAQLVAQRVARCRNTERRERIHIAGREPAQAAVAEARVVFRLEYIRGAAAEVAQRSCERIGYAEVEGVFHEAAAHEKFHGQIVHLAHGAARFLGGEQPAHYLAYDDGACLKHLVVGRGLCCYGEVRAELILYGAAHLVA